MLNKRGCGILLHPTSLPGPGGIGSLGADARRFMDLLHEMRMSYWQILPLTPPAAGNSPYSAFTAFGGNPLLIDLERIAAEGDLAEASDSSRYPENHVDFTAVLGTKLKLLHQAGSAFLGRKENPRADEYRHFCETTPWLHDFALFMALKQRFHGKCWDRWPEEASRISMPTGISTLRLSSRRKLRCRNTCSGSFRGNGRRSVDMPTNGVSP
jgi:4-alpha-glucanotransferase